MTSTETRPASFTCPGWCDGGHANDSPDQADILGVLTTDAAAKPRRIAGEQPRVRGRA